MSTFEHFHVIYPSLFFLLVVQSLIVICPVCRTFISQVITGYLPSLILLLFLKIVPPIMEFLSSIQGYICHSDIEKSACNKVLWFTIWNIFFATVFSGSVLYQVSIILEPKNIPARLAVAVPAQVSIFFSGELL